MRAIWKDIKLYVLIAVVALAAFIIYKYSLLSYLSEENMERIVRAAGPWGPLVFIGINVLRPLLLLPVGLFSVVAGVMFGTVYGTIYTSVGVVIGSILAFYIAKYFGRDFIVRHFGDKLNNFDRISSDHGFIIIMLLRITPILPVDAISYGAGLSKISVWDFILGTVIGILPGTFVYVYMGAILRALSIEKIIIAIILFIAAMLIPLIWKDKIKYLISGNNDKKGM
ncbi:TVP38/TMEM64 family protein [Mahella australiensis]|uniref:TVP38/TMEM64 family membrane protein n=1 Tax=Mahella australiensis (strain DSM 15567 / CIP 107919 / 50-1 BON) TaxID=697281 RepID=F4A007_MAHA5|nr:TVP38/TMEM64 family protein [Mahella australiensis]AEE95825.1 SNARE associated Golgi protein-related protein [Mahella australiensis 50-1 BON]